MQDRLSNIFEKLVKEKVMVIFAYAGQGSQYVSMGTDMYESFPEYKQVLDKFDNYSHIKELMKDGPAEELTQTENTQPAFALFAAGVTEVLRANGINPDGACGLSLGEYGALYAADVLSMEDYVNTVAYRGKVMQEAAKGLSCAMSAILGLEADKVTEVVKAAYSEIEAKGGYVTVANYNCPGQYVICGDEEAVSFTEEKLKEAGAKRCIRLNVSGPFHTKYMQPAADKLKARLDEIDIKEAKIPVTLNSTGNFLDKDSDLRALLEKQIRSSVHFEEDVIKFLDKGADVFIEIGPGKVLTGFIKKIAAANSKEVKIYTVDKAEDLNKVISELSNN